MAEQASKITRKKAKPAATPVPQEPQNTAPILKFDADYVRDSLIPNLNAVLLQTKLGGDARLISRFRFNGGMGGYVFGLYRFDVTNHKYNSAIQHFLLAIGFSPAHIIALRRGGELDRIRINALSEQLEAALQNPANMAALRRLNKTWAQGLVAALERLLGVLSTTNPAVAEQIFRSPELQLRVLDYANQHGGFKEGDPLERWLSGQMETPVKPLVPGQELTQDDINAFVKAGQFG